MDDVYIKKFILTELKKFNLQIGHQSERKCMGSTGDLWTDQRIFPAKTVCIYPL